MQVLLIGAGEIVRAAEILLGAHVEVVVVHMVEHGVDASYARYADGAWWKTWVLIRVV